ncbi:IS3 family transposase [Myroides marinus]|uniref:IS3 family transposase n=2 Tax=Myroides marinus TaxID=703342 RepID=UPI0025761D5C|nr:IS3 family transposase [Myroides marinus]MDM1350923.1 IS3 family transposase [Myroides marinus]MDM1358130.1 IS3 family transposase [Myroides marinus]MDM1377337.1 IS3 family transposase [Myroides marinus]
MKNKHPKVSLENLCGLFGFSRQAYYEAITRRNTEFISNSIVLCLVNEIREDMPFIGTRKLLHLLEPKLEEHIIKIGRDQLFNLLRFHGLLIRRRKKIARTTNSNHPYKRYPDLIKNLEVTRSNQVWVSDITYIRTVSGFSYLSLLTDLYSRKIVGYCLYPSLEAVGCLNALKMAIALNPLQTGQNLIHHSDRGVQYCSFEYTKLLLEHDIQISMTQNGNPYDNALAERVNGILKNEFYPKRVYLNHQDAVNNISKIVKIYNLQRPHSSIDYLTPQEAHLKSGEIKKRWKNYKKSYSEVVKDY